MDTPTNRLPHLLTASKNHMIYSVIVNKTDPEEKYSNNECNYRDAEQDNPKDLDHPCLVTNGDVDTNTTDDLIKVEE